MKELTEGLYPLAPNCTAFVRGGNVIVSLKRKAIDETPRCRNCAHFGQGHNRYNQRHESSVCFARPKTNGLTNGYPSEVREQQRYYATQGAFRACNHYQPKITRIDETAK